MGFIKLFGRVLGELAQGKVLQRERELESSRREPGLSEEGENAHTACCRATPYSSSRSSVCSRSWCCRHCCWFCRSGPPSWSRVRQVRSCLLLGSILLETLSLLPWFLYEGGGGAKKEQGSEKERHLFLGGGQI